MSALQAQPSAATSLPIGYDKRLMLFSGRANPELAANIAAKLGVDLGPVTLKTFSNGEVYCRFEESIRGADVFLIQPTCGNRDTGITANDALIELLLMIDAAVGASAHRVIAVTPWYGYSRQDKKSAPREPISARLVARCLEAAGADRVLTMDLHAGQVQGFFQIPVDHMTALMMLTQYFEDLGLSDLVVVAPDAGRVKLNKKFASKLGAELAILDKERPAQQVAEIGYVIGDVRGRTAIIVDDMIDTAGTLKAAAQTVLDEGAARVFAAATHPVFSGNAFENLASRRVRADRRHRHDPARPRRARQHPRPAVRGPADRLDPPDLHRRLGVRGLRRREPALLTAAAVLQQRLGLTDDELCTVLAVDALTLIGSQELPHRPELSLLLALTEEHDPAVLRPWLRTGPLAAAAAPGLRRVRGRPRRPRPPRAGHRRALNASATRGPRPSRPARRR